MRTPLSSDDLIEALVKLHCGEENSARTKYLLRESLRNLVRLARIEEAELLLGQLRRSPAPGESVFH
jgi:hypothetical protein